MATFISLGYLPLKYAYCGSGAHTHQAYASSGEYDQTVGVILPEPRLAALKSLLPKCDIVDLGIGTGHATRTILDLIGSADSAQRYLALDFSRELIHGTVPLLRRSVHFLRISAACWDCESCPTRTISRWRRDRPVVLIFAGNTLGNVENPSLVLTNIRKSLKAGDLMLLQLSLWDKENDVSALLKPYQTELFRAAALQPLISIGIHEDSGTYSVAFDRLLKTISAYFKLNQEISLSAGTVLTRLPTDHIIRCLLSRRFVMDEMSVFLAEHGWTLIWEERGKCNSTGVFLVEAR